MRTHQYGVLLQLQPASRPSPRLRAILTLLARMFVFLRNVIKLLLCTFCQNLAFLLNEETEVKKNQIRYTVSIIIQWNLEELFP